VVVETAADRTAEEPSEEALMAYSGGRDAVREPVMRELRASIREHQIRGVTIEKIHDWIDRREAVGEISEEEGAIGRLIARHYTEVVWDAVYPVSIGA
jgi:predicted nucleotidyltransferase